MITLYKLIRIDSDNYISVLEVYRFKDNAEKQRDIYSNENPNFKYEIKSYNCHVEDLSNSFVWFHDTKEKEWSFMHG